MSKPDRLRRLSRSLFTRLFLVFIGIALIVLILPVVYMRVMEKPGEKRRDEFHQNVVLFADCLVDALGTPPDSRSAERLRSENGILIQASGPAGPPPGFSSPPDTLLAMALAEKTESPLPGEEGLLKRLAGSLLPPPFLGPPPPPAPQTDRGRVTMLPNQLTVLVQRGETRYFVSFLHGQFPPPILVGPLIAMIAAALLAGFCLVFWLLRPLKALSEGVKQVGAGRLSHEVPVCGRDELGELAVSFNHMTGSIRRMIADKEQLLVDVSHELRSPLTRLRVALELLDDAARDKLMPDVKELEAMLTELLESARLSSGPGGLRREPTALAGLVEQVKLIFQNRPPGLKVSAISRDWIVSVDRDRMQTVLNNVLDNACKYSGDQAQPIELSVVLAPALLQIVIRDHGPGIPAEERTTVFEPFYRVDKSRRRAPGGFGLGLSLCKKIVEAHGGEICLLEPPGRGTIVMITLPIAAPGR